MLYRDKMDKSINKMDNNDNDNDMDNDYKIIYKKFIFTTPPSILTPAKFWRETYPYIISIQN